MCTVNRDQHENTLMPVLVSTFVTGKVRYEDQQKINEFGRLNNRLLEIREDKSHMKVPHSYVSLVYLIWIYLCIIQRWCSIV